MEKTQISVAGLTVGIETLYGSLGTVPACYLSDSASCDFRIAVTEDDIALERRFMQKEQPLPGADFSDAQLEFTAVYRKMAQFLPQYQAIIMHGSAVAVDGAAYLFTARSGVGKTTHSRLWLKNIPGSFIVNGDKPILRVINGQVLVCGTPWNGKEHFGTGSMVPLRAVCLLSRGAENRIEPAPFAEMLPYLLSQTYRSDDRGVFVQTLRVIGSMAEKLRFYRLSCNMEDEAALAAYRGMAQ